jgi:hypothetical protein
MICFRQMTANHSTSDSAGADQNGVDLRQSRTDQQAARTGVSLLNFLCFPVSVAMRSQRCVCADFSRVAARIERDVEEGGDDNRDQRCGNDRNKLGDELFE